MAKKYNSSLIQGYFAKRNITHLGELTGDVLGGLLIVLGWHTDDDLQRTATNCLAWVRKNLHFEASEERFSPSKVVKASVEHIKKASPLDIDTEMAATSTERPPRVVKSAATARVTALLQSEKPTVENVGVVSEKPTAKPQSQPQPQSCTTTDRSATDVVHARPGVFPCDKTADTYIAILMDLSDQTLKMDAELTSYKHEVSTLRAELQYTRQALDRMMVEMQTMAAVCQELYTKQYGLGGTVATAGQMGGEGSLIVEADGPAEEL
ncbi:hypothetical protein Tdes44962_MAKER09618 [Teratosphaeria destructans]|uniref:Uncharacterized protein n=1 Tax=Teratosphaeria destructans TaxID=418781 RepID=A0A9W7SSF5_9PEZI|nr:hypothetical protein Tdes44962_MAKER09618 [Teratosphaeria destructans]